MPDEKRIAQYSTTTQQRSNAATQQRSNAAYDAWFKAQVQTSLDDPRPSIPNEEVKHLMAIKREKLRQG
ncbi:antitoxin PaaA2 family protein [Pseudomonas sp. RT4P38]